LEEEEEEEGGAGEGVIEAERVGASGEIGIDEGGVGDDAGCVEKKENMGESRGGRRG